GGDGVVEGRRRARLLVRLNLVDRAAARMPYLVGPHYDRQFVCLHRLQHNEGTHYIALNIIGAVPYIEPVLSDKRIADSSPAILKYDDCVMISYSACRNCWRAGSHAEGSARRRGEGAERWRLGRT